MKKVLSILIIAVMLTSCTAYKPSTDNGNGIWITYYELSAMLKSESGFKAEFKDVIKNCKKLKIQNLYIHTRAFGDSLYPSDYFPQMKDTGGYDYDIFEHILGECKKNGLKVHAWINPYRISSSTTNIDEIANGSPAYKWLNDQNSENDSNVGFANGIYFNPAKPQVRALVVDGIRELIAKYEIDGIHFDDYFYPTQSEDFDKNTYNEYIKSTANPLSLADWRRLNVNTLIRECYTAIKYANADIIFSISPAASVKDNYNNLYADVSYWIQEGLIDKIIPQLYFGFEYPDEDFKFNNILNEWKSLAQKNQNVKLKIGLASYKAQPTLEADKKEWQENFDIIARQVEVCENDAEVTGYLLFSYSSVFSEEEEYKKQRENLIKYIEQGEK